MKTKRNIYFSLLSGKLVLATYMTRMKKKKKKFYCQEKEKGIKTFPVLYILTYLNGSLHHKKPKNTKHVICHYKSAEDTKNIASAVSPLCPNCICVIPGLEQGFLYSLYFSLFTFHSVFESLGIEGPGLGIQLDVQALTWMIRSFHLSAIPLGSSSTVMLSLSCV